MGVYIYNTPRFLITSAQIISAAGVRVAFCMFAGIASEQLSTDSYLIMNYGGIINKIDRQ
jgi:hypothetical protein